MPTLPAGHLLDRPAPDAPRKAWARYWISQGWAVLPLHEVMKNGSCTCKENLGCKQKGKHPRTKTGVTEATRDVAVSDRWFTNWPTANIGGACIARLAIDIDVRHGGVWPTGDAFPPTRKHLSGRGDGGGHLIYSLTREQQNLNLRSNNTGKLGEGLDIRVGAGGYLVMPPSWHEEGGQYEVVSELEVDAPDALIQLLLGDSRAALDSGEAVIGEGGEVRSLLSSLMAKKPSKGERNSWLSTVAGHYAKTYHKQRDLYVMHVAQANEVLAEPLDEIEVKKVTDSIWRKEKENHPDREKLGEADSATGWLIGDGRQLLTPVTAGPKEDQRIELAGWADFDVKATGVIVEPEQRTWMVQLSVLRNGAKIERALPSRILSDPKQLNTWLAASGVSIVPPERMRPATGSISTRLTRYLESQDAPSARPVQYLGWDEEIGGFVTQEEVIQANGVISLAQAGVHPATRLSQLIEYHYGFEGSALEAQALLAHVLTLHDETVCSVYGAWWAALLIKPQIMPSMSQFPLVKLEAPSESGKTTGFFALMMKLGGNRRGQVNPTVPALRDLLSCHRSASVIVDDVDNPEAFLELARAVTVEGTIVKKGEDRTRNIEAKLVSGLVLSGETAGINGQKALEDRAITLEVPNPKERMSRTIPGAKQWADIEALARVYPEATGGLTAFSGWYVQQALAEMGEIVDGLSNLRPNGTTGRWADKMAIVRAGGRLLDRLAGTTGGGEASVGMHAERVDAWVDKQINLGEENTLTKTILPAALAAYGSPDFPEFDPGARLSYGVPTPVYVVEDIVWFSTSLLATWWAKHQQGRVRARTETADALADQAKRLGLDGVGHKVIRLKGGGLQRYRAADTKISLVVLMRASGGRNEDHNGGRNTQETLYNE